jgi:hypothetical protein
MPGFFKLPKFPDCLGKYVHTLSYLIIEHQHHVCYCTGLIIIHERLFQSIKPDSTKESLDQFAQTVTSSFHENYHQKWVDAVKKQSWWMMSKQKTAEKLRDLVMEHRMVSFLCGWHSFGLADCFSLCHQFEIF